MDKKSSMLQSRSGFNLRTAALNSAPAGLEGQYIEPLDVICLREDVSTVSLVDGMSLR